MVLELEQRTRLHFEDNDHDVLDYICEWQAAGKTLIALANEISDDESINPPIDGRTIRRWLDRKFDKQEVEERLAEAREAGAYAMVDAALHDAEQLTDKDQAPVVRVRNDARFWTAQRFNRRQLGEPKAGVSLTLNVGSLHLDAMRQRSIEAAKEGSPVGTAHARSLAVCHNDTGGGEGAEGGGAIASAITQDAEVVSIEDTTT